LIEEKSKVSNSILSFRSRNLLKIVEDKKERFEKVDHVVNHQRLRDQAFPFYALGHSCSTVSFGAAWVTCSHCIGNMHNAVMARL